MVELARLFGGFKEAMDVKCLGTLVTITSASTRSANCRPLEVFGLDPCPHLSGMGGRGDAVSLSGA